MEVSETGKGHKLYLEAKLFNSATNIVSIKLNCNHKYVFIISVTLHFVLVYVY